MCWLCQMLSTLNYWRLHCCKMLIVSNDCRCGTRHANIWLQCWAGGFELISKIFFFCFVFLCVAYDVTNLDLFEVWITTMRSNCTTDATFFIIISIRYTYKKMKKNLKSFFTIVHDEPHHLPNCISTHCYCWQSIWRAPTKVKCANLLFCH